MKITNRPDLKKLVTFIPNKKEPIHNWYHYKEGYSKQLVDYFIEQLNIQKNHVVLDPFCGVGTTLLTCKQHGIKSIGFDSSPLCVFVSRVKTENYDVRELESSVKDALKWKIEKHKKIPDNKWLKKAFSRYVLEDIVSYKQKIFEIEDEKIRNFLLLALIDCSMMCSYAYKDGAVVKIRKRHVPPVRKVFKYKIRKMFKDYRDSDMPNTETKTELGDARELFVTDDGADFIITSPPYLNKIEYSKIYQTEYALFFKEPKTKIRSHIENEEKFYFRDMRKVLEEMKRTCTGRMAIVIGGGCYPDHVVLVDERLAEIAEDVGLKVKQILAVRNSWCTKSRTVKIGQIRESIVVLE